MQTYQGRKKLPRNGIGCRTVQGYVQRKVLLNSQINPDNCKLCTCNMRIVVMECASPGWYHAGIGTIDA